MASIELYRDARRAVRKSSNRLTTDDRQAVRTFLLSTAEDVHREQRFATELIKEVIIHQDHAAGRMYNALDSIRDSLLRFSEGEPIRSTLRMLAFAYVDRWVDTMEREEEEYNLNQLMERQLARLLGRKKKAKPRKKAAKK